MNIDEMQAGPELDALVAEHIMKWSIKEHPSRDHPRMWMAEKGKGYLTGWTADDGSVACEASLPFGVFRPSVDWGAAGVVFEKINTIFDGFTITRIRRTRYRANLIYASALAETAPLAICRAALKAILGIDKT